MQGDGVSITMERDGLIVDVGVDGVLRAGWGGGLGAVATRTVQRVSAASRGI